MVQKDYESGTYVAGKFFPYKGKGEYSARLDPGSNEEAKEDADQAQILHGTYKDGVFRPADITERPGYANNVTLDDGETYRINHEGEMCDSQGMAIGRLDEEGNPDFYRFSSQGNTATVSDREVESGEEDSRNFKYDFGTITGKVNNQLTDMANYIARSGKILGKFRDNPANKNIKTRIYEAKIPQFERDSDGYAIRQGFSGESVDGDEHVVIIDKRLKDFEKIATVTHELSHVYGGTGKKDPKEEHDAHLAAINQASKLYENYEDLKRATANSSNPFFDVTKQSKRDIGKAVAYLVGTKDYFGVKEGEISQNEPILRKVKGDLEGKVEAPLAIVTIMVSLGFLSLDITGSVVADLPAKTASLIGIGLFSFGLLAGLLWYRSRKAVSLFNLGR